MKKILLLVVLFFALASQAAAQMKIEVIPLKGRSVEETIPVIRPLVGPGGSVSGMQGKLIVRTTPKNLAEIRSVLERIDTVPRNLRIMVRQGVRRKLNRRETDVSADVRVGEGRVFVNPGAPDSGGLTVGGRSGNSTVSGRIGSTSLDGDSMGTQQILAVEGRPAMIHFTRSIPVREVKTIKSGKKTIRRESIGYKNVTTGLTVLTRIQGERVVIEVNPVLSSLQPHGIESQEIHTTVSGKLGEWIELGGLSIDDHSTNRQILGSSSVEAKETRSVYIKVEEQP